MISYINTTCFKRLLSWADIAFFEWAEELLMYASHLPKSCKLVTRMHRYEFYKWIDRIDWEKVDKIFVVSEAKKNLFQNRFPIHANKLDVVYPMVDLDVYKEATEKHFGNRLGTVANIIPRKRIYELIIAFHELKKRIENATLRIAGSAIGSEREYYEIIRGAVTRMNLNEAVAFDGDVSPAEMPSWYSSIDVFVSNSSDEGFQVGLLEAMASGCFCLSHFWAGVDELLPKEQVYISDFELIDKVSRYLQLSQQEKRGYSQKMRGIVQNNCEFMKGYQQLRTGILNALE